MTSYKNKEWLREYEEFLNDAPAPVPKEVTEEMLRKMKKLLNPSAWTIFAKVFGIHLFIGTLSLSICHQFGLNLFHTKYSLADWFMYMGGHEFCMVACGVMFVGLSLGAAGYILSIEELRVLRRTKALQIGALGLFSLGLFGAAGAQFAIAIAGLWLLGSLIGGFVATEAVWRLKQI